MQYLWMLIFVDWTMQCCGIFLKSIKRGQKYFNVVDRWLPHENILST